MAKRWTSEEDSLILAFHEVGADFVAFHDLGRPEGAGERRLKKLTESGARRHFAEAMLHLLEFDRLAGRKIDEEEVEKWERERRESEG